MVPTVSDWVLNTWALRDTSEAQQKPARRLKRSGGGLETSTCTWKAPSPHPAAWVISSICLPWSCALYHKPAIVSVVIGFSCQAGTSLQSPGKREPPLKNRLNQIGLRPCLWGAFLIANWCRRTQPIVNSAIIPRQVSLSWGRKQAGQARGKKSLKSKGKSRLGWAPEEGAVWQARPSTVGLVPRLQLCQSWIKP